MGTLGCFFVVLVQRKNDFEGLVTIEANIIVNGHGTLPWELRSQNCTPARDCGLMIFDS